jgi:hypothetical protein
MTAYYIIQLGKPFGAPGNGIITLVRKENRVMSQSGSNDLGEKLTAVENARREDKDFAERLEQDPRPRWRN